VNGKHSAGAYITLMPFDPNLTFRQWFQNSGQQVLTQKDLLARLSHAIAHHSQLLPKLKQFNAFLFDPAFPIDQTDIDRYVSDQDTGDNEMADLIRHYGRNFSSMNPVILAPIKGSDRNTILDGSHRIRAFMYKGEKTVPAYIGLREIDSPYFPQNH